MDSPHVDYLYIRFTGGAWVTLDFGSAGSWSVGTVVYLANRSDTHQLNRSPVTTGKPMYTYVLSPAVIFNKARFCKIYVNK